MPSTLAPVLTDLAAIPALDPAQLDAAALKAAAEIVEEGTPANTARSYASAWRYWAAWYGLRYALPFGDAPVPVAVATQFVLDHLARQTKDGLRHELPAVIDAHLVALSAKGKPGPLAFATVNHRLAVLAKWHRLQGWDSPTDDHRLKSVVAKAKRAQATRGVTVRKKTAAVAEPLQAMLATCSDGIRGIRDRALLLLTWSGGGRRRSEVVGLEIAHVRRVHDTLWMYSLGATKTDTSGTRREKPLKGDAALALAAWLRAAAVTEGPLFRRVYRSGRVGSHALSGEHVARMVQRRARLAGLSGDWAAHSLRSGFVTEAGRQGVPLGEVMALTEHSGVSTVMGYFQAGTLLSSRASTLLEAHPPLELNADKLGTGAQPR